MVSYLVCYDVVHTWYVYGTSIFNLPSVLLCRCQVLLTLLFRYDTAAAVVGYVDSKQQDRQYKQSETTPKNTADLLLAS